MTNAEREVIRAVGRLYRSNPGVVRFEVKKRPNGEHSYGEDCYRWYREPWMTPILNAYRTMLRVRRKRNGKGNSE